MLYSKRSNCGGAAGREDSLLFFSPFLVILKLLLKHRFPIYRGRALLFPYN